VGGPVLSEEAIEVLLAQRMDARKAKNFVESDRIRDELKARGILIEDSATGTRWRMSN
jgi:cysteinyl-tRNA synthetase